MLHSLNDEAFFSRQITTPWGADKGAAALISGSVEVGFFGPEASIYVYQQGAEDYLVGFSQLTQRDGSFFMSRETPPDQFDWQDVRGTTIVGARRGGVPQMVLEWVLKQHGIEPFQDVEVLTNLAFEAAVGAYESGLGDYIAQFEPAMSEAQARGNGYIVASLGAEAGPIAYTVYHARKSALEENPELFERFNRAIVRGLEWVHQHSAEDIAEVITRFFPAIESHILVQNIENYKSIDAWPKDPTPSQEGFENLQRVMDEAGELGEPVPFEVLMNTEIAK